LFVCVFVCLRVCVCVCVCVCAFCCVLFGFGWGILGWGPFLTILGPILIKDESTNDPKQQKTNREQFLVLGGILEHLGSIFDPRWIEQLPKRAPKVEAPKTKSTQDTVDRKWGQDGPRSDQDGAKGGGHVRQMLVNNIWFLLVYEACTPSRDLACGGSGSLKVTKNQ